MPVPSTANQVRYSLQGSQYETGVFVTASLSGAPRVELTADGSFTKEQSDALVAAVVSAAVNHLETETGNTYSGDRTYIGTVQQENWPVS